MVTDPDVRAHLSADAPTSASRRNPAWAYDELILALDLYLRRGVPATDDPEVVALSKRLNRLPIHEDRAVARRFRNANAVHMKLANYLTVDPSYTGTGLSAGGRGVHEVWEVFADDPEALAAAVERITASADNEGEVLASEEDEAQAVEGRILFREHRVRERDGALVRRKKAAVLKKTGRLACEVCNLDFGERYGDVGSGFIECHHTVPLALGSKRRTRLSDLAVVCANCHRMIHRARPALTILQLRSRIAALSGR